MIQSQPLLFRLLAKTNLVDCEYYQAKYSDVLNAGIDPVRHYFLYGWREGRFRNKRHEVRGEAIKKLLQRFIAGSILVLQRFIAGSILDQIGEGRQLTTSQAYKAALFEAAGRGSREEVDQVVSRYYDKALQQVEKLLLARVRTVKLLNDADLKAKFKTIEQPGALSFFEPAIVGESRSAVQRTVEVPRKYITQLRNATVIGGFQVIVDDRLVCYEPAADPHAGFVAGIWPFVAPMRGQDNEVVIWHEYKVEEFLPEAILLSGRCSPNYFHWLIEYLGKAYILSKSDELRGIPLIVDADMYPQEFESLQAVLPGWPIFKLQKQSLLHVEKLHIPSVNTYHPDTLSIPYWQGSAVCINTLTYLRTSVFEKFGISDEAPPPSRKIFLARRAGRNIINTNDVERLLMDFGFEIVETGSLSFEQQVRLFFEARVIVGPMGAAFTNLIFCRPGTQVLALSSPFTKRFCMQSILATFAGCGYRILAGVHPEYTLGAEETVKDLNLSMDSFTIDIAQLAEALSVLA